MYDGYKLPDGSPRFGARAGTAFAEQPALAVVRPETAAEAAAALSLDALAAAADRRLAAGWADSTDPALEWLRKSYPEDLAAAGALVTRHLGSNRQWRLKAQTVRDRRLETVLDRRRASGNAREILILRLGLLAALIAVPSYVVATGAGFAKLILAGALCFAAASIGGYFLTARARIPVMPEIRGAWLNELRVDVVDATFVAILQNKGAPMAPGAFEAGRRGWESIMAASKAMELLHS